MLRIPKNFRKECENYTLAEKYRAFSDMYDMLYNRNHCMNEDRKLLLKYRSIKGHCKEVLYEKVIKELGKTNISDFDIIFTDWVYTNEENCYKDTSNIRTLCSGNRNLLDENDLLPYRIRYDSIEENVLDNATNQILIGSAASNGLHNHDDPYIDNLRSSNIAPYGNQQVNITQPNPTTQNYGDEIVPYEFNFTRQRFTSPEEVLNHVIGSNQQNVNPIYQQPCYIDQWGNIIYYNPQSY